MSALNFVAKTAAIALGAGVKKTVLQLQAPATQRLRVTGWGVFFDGIAAAGVPVLAVLDFQGDPGVGGTPNVPDPLDAQLGMGSNAIGQDNIVTAEPGSTGEPDKALVHPQQGYEKLFPPGQEPIVAVGQYIGIHCTAPAGVNVVAKIFYEE